MPVLRPLLALAAVAALAACDPPIPDSSPRGSGFETPAQVAEREARLRRGAPTPSQTIQPPQTPPGSVVDGGPAEAPLTRSEAEQLAADTRTALGVPAPQPPVSLPAGGVDPISDPVTLPPAPGGTPVAGSSSLDRDNPGISREQDFGAVAEARSIEADAARVRAARQQFEVVDPTPLARPDEVGPNIISYALERARPVGAAGTYRRGITASQRAADRRCRGYRTSDVAQEEFLSAGGPERDRLGLDPDGDGNACNWDPARFRTLVGN